VSAPHHNDIESSLHIVLLTRSLKRVKSVGARFHVKRRRERPLQTFHVKQGDGSFKKHGYGLSYSSAGLLGR
jgi:hypothetical protein